jgi:hypothetical protein
MRLRFVLAILVSLSAGAAQLAAQDLAPRAYLITPVSSNAITIIWAFYDGGVDFNGTVPIGHATGTYYVPIFSYYHSLNFFGRSANIAASLPYAVGNFQGSVSGQSRSIPRGATTTSPTCRFVSSVAVARCPACCLLESTESTMRIRSRVPDGTVTLVGAACVCTCVGVGGGCRSIGPGNAEAI